MKKLFYAGMPGDGTGWGVCNANLIAALSKVDGVQLVDEVDSDTVVFQPLADHDFNATSEARGWKNLGYTFFEFPNLLTAKTMENAKRYDVVFCGSTWCLERMRERGITNGKVLVQGVNHEVFKPPTGNDRVNIRTGTTRPTDGEFWIFSGGKFEYRKGQDLVLAAFKEILKTHPKARLITAWQNAWPLTMESMRESPHIKFELRGDRWSEQLGHLCDINGIPKDRVLTLPGIIPNERMADIYRQCDLGLFPNRCEGGTNLVLMEFVACGRPAVIGHLTGHSDVFGAGMFGCRPKFGRDHWAEYDVAEIVEEVQHWIGRPAKELEEHGAAGARAMQRWTWERAARTILEDV
jgi:glycosyltransferase involved in cell wall biosynthesis